MSPIPLRLALVLLPAAPLLAQTYTTMTETRQGATPYKSVLQVEGGAIGTQADPRDEVVGLDDDISWDGRVYWRNGSVGRRRSTIEAYAGRDGLAGSWQDGKLIGDETVTRVEVRARPWMFYRDGFYDGSDRLRANGFYEGRDYEAYLGFGKDLQPGLYLEFGPYYRSLDFDARTYTPATVDTFRTPDDHNAYGGRLYIEQATVEYDRRRLMPRQGFVLSLLGEREWNDSDREFGTDVYATSLASAYWRMRGRLAWYVPATDDLCWEIFGMGGWQDDKDRLQNTEGQRPLGSQWGDAQIRLRIHVGLLDRALRAGAVLAHVGRGRLRHRQELLLRRRRRVVAALRRSGVPARQLVVPRQRQPPVDPHRPRRPRPAHVLRRHGAAPGRDPLTGRYSGCSVGSHSVQVTATRRRPS
jgi:hypothetical protein